MNISVNTVRSLTASAECDIASTTAAALLHGCIGECVNFMIINSRGREPRRTERNGTERPGMCGHYFQLEHWHFTRIAL